MTQVLVFIIVLYASTTKVIYSDKFTFVTDKNDNDVRLKHLYD